MNSKIWHVYADGPLACFTAVEAKAERYSYPIPTPSAVEGFLKGILGKHEIQWHIHETRVLSKIRYMPIRRNELKFFGGGMEPVYADSEKVRTQRTTTLLRDPRYIFSVSLTINADALTQDMVKYENMFERRIRGGQHEYPPYFGLRELAAHRFHLVDDLKGLDPINLTENLGRMFYGHFYREGRAPESRYWDAKIVKGVVTYPSRQQVFGRAP